jgi:hypothetical protein
MQARRIVINGKEYASWEEVPEPLRRLVDLAAPGVRALNQDTTTFQIGGKQYSRLEDVPAEYRSLLEDRDGDSLPDCVKHPENLARVAGSAGGMRLNMTNANGATTYSIGDRTYHRLDDVPPEYRPFFADKDGDGVPDFVQDPQALSALGSPQLRKNVVIRFEPLGLGAWLRIVLIGLLLAGAFALYWWVRRLI